MRRTIVRLDSSISISSNGIRDSIRFEGGAATATGTLTTAATAAAATAVAIGGVVGGGSSHAVFGCVALSVSEGGGGLYGGGVAGGRVVQVHRHGRQAAE